MPWAILTPWALAGVAMGVVVSTAAAAATARVIFIMGVLLELDLEVQRVRMLRVPPGRCGGSQESARAADRQSENISRLRCSVNGTLELEGLILWIAHFL